MSEAATVERLGEVCVISLDGESDLYDAPGFRDALIGAIDAGARRVLVDLSASTFIDSTILGVMLEGHKRFRTDGGGEVGIVCVEPQIRKLLRVTTLDRVFQLYDHRSEGLLGLATGELGA